MSRYSQLYIDQPTQLPDSGRARRRLGKLLESMTPNIASPLGDLLDQELGTVSRVSSSASWPGFFESCSIRDMLDTITVAKDYIGGRRGANVGERWLTEVSRIFAEEHLAYVVDDKGIVHPAIDQEFQRNRIATLSGLQFPRYANSLAAFERVSDELAADPPNGKDAWRAVFSAVEGLFRLMFSSAPQLNAGAIEAHLGSLILKVHSSDPVALRAATKMVASFKDWVDASHNYRHEQGSEEPVQPPSDLAILAISNGAAFLRWLVALDQATPPGG